MSTSTWSNNPTSGEWNTAANWEEQEVPTDTANFSTSSQTSITFSATGNASINEIDFNTDASAYTFTFGNSTTPSLTIAGQGINNESAKIQSFIVAASTVGYQEPQLKFSNSATAGNSDMYYCAGPASTQGYGGGVISFCDSSSAGSAIFKVWTGAGQPPEHSTVGGEVSFSDNSTAATAQFTIYGTLGTDGDTFGNVVFHDSATAANGNFINIGGTVSGGDGGNTQFYNNSTAAKGTFNNRGGTVSKANGGDVAFDGTTSGGNAYFYNHAAPAEGAYGGVTSFNNNPPSMTDQGASAGNAVYHNYGATGTEQGGGGHMEFSAKYGSPTGDKATIVNYGSDIDSKSSAGHTIFSINLPTEYFPTAGNSTITNQPASGQEGAPGYTEFAVYTDDDSNSSSSGSSNAIPTAGDSTIINAGGLSSEATGGFTTFTNTSTAGNALLIAHGGSKGGKGGKINFYDQSTGGTAWVKLDGDGELDISYHTNGLTIAALELNNGVINTLLGTNVTTLSLTQKLNIYSNYTTFSFWSTEQGGFELNNAYPILRAPNLDEYTSEYFKGNSINEVEPTFSIDNNVLYVTLNQST